MCTVSWWRAEDSYGLLFNRDEARRRKAALAPELYCQTGVDYIAPIDGDASGTWIWVNHFGLIACLLNNYTVPGGVAGEPVSRGLLLRSLARCSDADQIGAELADRSLPKYRGFLLLVFSGGGTDLFTWDGARLRVDHGDSCRCPITTSGFQPMAVASYRLARYAEMVGERRPGSAARLRRFHAQHDPDFPAGSVLMSRTEARTVSQTEVFVSAGSARLRYAAVSPELHVEPAVTATLPLVD